MSDNFAAVADAGAGDTGAGEVNTEQHSGSFNEPNIHDAVDDGIADDGAPRYEKDKPKAPPAADQKYRVKVDGEEVELTLAELQQHASMGKAAQKRMQEAAAERKRIEDVVMAMKANPAAALKHLGIDPEEFAKQQLNQALLQKYEPEKWQAMQEQRELQSYREQMQQQQRMQEQQAVMAQRRADAESLMGEISQAFNESNFVQDDRARAFKAYHALKLIAADRIKSTRENRAPSLSIKEALTKTDTMMNKMYVGFLNTLPPDQLASLLGPDARKKLRNYDLQEFKAKRTPTPPVGQRNVAPTAPSRKDSGRKAMSPAEWRDHLAKLRD